MFAAEAVGAAEELVGVIFNRGEDEVVGAGVGDGVAAEGLFKRGEAGPGVIFGGIIGGDAPEVEGGEAFCLGIFDRFDEEGVGDGELLMLEAGGGLHVEAGVVEVEEEGSADDLVRGGGF